MRPLTLTFCLLILTGPFALFANADIRGMWTNGWEEYSASRMNDSMWHFEGAYLHEGGLAFDLKTASDSSFVILTSEDHIQPSVGKTGNKVAYRVMDGHAALVVYTKSGAIDDIFTVKQRGRKLEDLVSHPPRDNWIAV